MDLAWTEAYTDSPADAVLDGCYAVSAEKDLHCIVRLMNTRQSYAHCFAYDHTPAVQSGFHGDHNSYLRLTVAAAETGEIGLGCHAPAVWDEHHMLPDHGAAADCRGQIVHAGVSVPSGYSLNYLSADSADCRIVLSQPETASGLYNDRLGPADWQTAANYVVQTGLAHLFPGSSAVPLPAYRVRVEMPLTAFCQARFY